MVDHLDFTGLVVAVGLPPQQLLTDPTAEISGTEFALVAILGSR
ncbi:MAG: hypothetical protein QOI78_8161 [Actinomycetota bacterium]|nr:hypothetical protein [Actinomycetota bacterium]